MLEEALQAAIFRGVQCRAGEQARQMRQVHRPTVRQPHEQNRQRLQTRLAEGLVGGERFAADASLIHADANKLNSNAKEDWDLDAINPETAPRAVVEYLSALDDAAFGAATDVTPKFTSHSDPSSQSTAAHHGPAYFAYSNNKIVSATRSV